MPETPEITAPLVLGSRWAISPAGLARVAEAHRLLDRAGALPEPRAAAPLAARRAAGQQRASGAVAIIPLTGVVTPRGSFLSMLFGGGGGGLIDFRDAFREAVQSPDVGAIVLEVDSPGGLVDLVPETAAEIRDARGSKPITAVANTMAASAAYWIASQADELVVTPSGSVGSVGVYMVHEDYSGWNDKQGIAPTYISAGKYKTEGNPDEPLSDAARADWQQEVDDLYTMFVDAVAAGRNITTDQVRAGYGEGRVLLADRALSAGMVDRVDTLEAVVGGLLGASSAGGRSAAAAVGRAALARARAEAPAPAEQPEAEPEPDTPPVNDPTHVPDETPDELEQPDEIVEPDIGPDTPDPEARAAFASVLL